MPDVEMCEAIPVSLLFHIFMENLCFFFAVRGLKMCFWDLEMNDKGLCLSLERKCAIKWNPKQNVSMKHEAKEKKWKDGSAENEEKPQKIRPY